MKNLRIRLIALVMALAVLLSGCYDINDYMRLLNIYITGTVPVVKFEDMEYTRPDPAGLLDYQAQCVELAQAGDDFDALEDAVWYLYEEYYNFYTNYSLADIHYSQDLTDLYWEEEYLWCLEASAEVDAAMDQMFFVLAASDYREALERDDLFGAGFFDDYMGESVWDETFTALMEQESVLIGRYYDLSTDLMEYEPGTRGYEATASALVDLYVELIALRQEQASYSGYGNYLNFAYEFYYGRDYSPAQEELYLSQVREHLVPLYRQVCSNGVDGIGYSMVTEEQTFDYVKETARNMGGTVEEAFNTMVKGNLYDISFSPNKYASSFEVFLLDYYEPFIFMNPEGTSYDQLTFAHEFGHFCNDYASYGSQLGIDSMEVFSQGMEYLSLEYASDTEDLAKLKMMDSLCVYVEQSAYAAFEQEVYRLHADDLTGQNIMALFEEITDQFGFDIWDTNGTDFVEIPHLFTSPMYIFSYVVSNDAALQLYQIELEQPGAGLALLEENLDSTAGGFLEFLKEAGLDSPFIYGRLEEVKATFENILT